MKIVIQQVKKSENEKKINPIILWKVTVGDKSAEDINYEEMIGLITALTLPNENRPCLRWLRTEAQNKAMRDSWGRAPVVLVEYEEPTPAKIEVPAFPADRITREFNGSC